MRAAIDRLGEVDDNRVAVAEIDLHRAVLPPPPRRGNDVRAPWLGRRQLETPEFLDFRVDDPDRQSVLGRAEMETEPLLFVRSDAKLPRGQDGTRRWHAVPRRGEALTPSSG
jgi:hypothetical protein